MYMIVYDFDNFLSTIRHLDYPDVIVTVRAQLNKMAGKATKGDALAFSNKLKGLLQWMQTGKKPRALTQVEFQKFKSLGENLVSKKQLESSVLAQFR